MEAADNTVYRGCREVDRVCVWGGGVERQTVCVCVLTHGVKPWEAADGTDTSCVFVSGGGGVCLT